ncbi:MAG: NADH-quinone oxidoreductase subunit NuoF [Gemmatimonadota bacterium]|nr:MAG: NADH-quinone oxidoreductase subunit NuoF [Gemmatimonadota bacterium]
MELKAYRTHLLVCAGTGCVSNHSFDIKAALEQEIKKQKLENEIVVITTGCNGFCERGPIVFVQQEGIYYQMLKLEDIPFLVEEHFVKHRPVEKLMYIPPDEEKLIPTMSEIDFFKHQRLIVLKNRGRIDPESIDEYIAFGGYESLAKALLLLTPEEIIDEIKTSGLRGRGGGGFPTGIKWELTRKAPGNIKYIICNADEGDPGAFMDRSILEADPHAVLEGMAIGAYAIGATKGFVYVRNEYPLAVDRIKLAIRQAEDYGLLGERIFDTDFSFKVNVVRGAGAFVCGEETALMASVEGKIGRPRQRPPFPAQKGLWGKPTNINNVETWANVPVIIDRSGTWFSEIGTENSKGTKIFSLVGKVNNTGLVEVPMGITLRQIIFDIGGGVQKEKAFKTVQIGGPSGGCIPKEHLDMAVDYDELKKVGAMMGSGGLIVMDEDTCMVDVAKYFTRFLYDESCGKCLSCRDGLKRMQEILRDITEGRATEADLGLLEDLAYVVKDASMCGLGQTAANPVLSSLRHFRDEYEAHIKYKRCPAAVCKEIISSPCQHICPIGTEAPIYIALIAHGKYEDALNIIWKDNPLPSVCGRVCHHPCESKCRAGEGGDPIAIRTLKRFATDYALKTGIEPDIQRQPKREEKVAIVGSGPAGLTAGYFLALKGYEVTIFEALPVAGGMLAVGIPEHRLPKEILKADLDQIQKAGVRIETNVALGRDVTLEDLHKQGYASIFLATGAHKSFKLGIPGEEADGVFPSMRFLTDINLGRDVEVGKRVGVIGGGNAALDAARVALRLEGCEEVSIIYRRTRAEMPAYEEEIVKAIEEGIDIQFLAAPTKVLTENGRLVGIECVRMELGAMDESGRRRPIPVQGSEFSLQLDTLIAAIGEQPDLSFATDKESFDVSPWNTIIVDSETLATNQEGLWAGGDVVTGPGTVVEAIAVGKRAADSIDTYLRGEQFIRTYTVTRPSVSVTPVELTDEEIAETQRPEMPCLLVEERSKNFKEVELGYGEKMAVKEARRCLRCDLDVKTETEVDQDGEVFEKEKVHA